MNYLKRNVKYKNLTIGIYSDSFNGKTGVTTPYMNFLRLFGKPYFIDTTTTYEDVVKNCDVLLIPGGADVDSSRYNEAPHPTNSRVNVHYEWMDKKILTPWLVDNRPTIGICRGFQTINVILGGTLFQNVSNHQQTADRTRTTSVLAVPADNQEFDYYYINTLHHQAIKDLAPNLIPIGFSPVYENCESLEHENKLFVAKYITDTKEKKTEEWYSFCEAFINTSGNIFAVQYHPEEINCPFAIQNIDTMLNSIFVPEEVTA